MNLRVHLGDLATTLSLVWEASPLRTIAIALLSLVQAGLPAANMWVAKLLLDQVAAAIAGQAGTPGQAFNSLLGLLLLQVGLVAVGNVVGIVQGANRELLGDTLQNRISRRILTKAGDLELAKFEDPKVYDSLQNAYREVGSRPLGVFSQIITLGQAVVTLGSVSALMVQLGWAVVPLVLLASLPAVWVQSRFGTEGYRMIRRQAQDARRQNYLGNLLTNDQAVKEIRLFGFGDYLMAQWQSYYHLFRGQLVSLIGRRNYCSMPSSSTSKIRVASGPILAGPRSP